jgi:thioredoxin 1/putative thioredoxin
LGTGRTVVANVTEREFEQEVMNAPVPVVVAFVSERSNATRTLVADLQAFSDEAAGKARAVLVTVERAPTLTRQLRVQSVPTYMVWADGRPVDAVTGVLKPAQLRELVDPFLPRAEGALKAAELFKLLSEKRVVPVDTRDAAAFGRAHIPGAKHMDLETIDQRLAELHMLPGTAVLYCRSGDKTKEMAARLANQGAPVAFLEGGLLAWEAEGFRVERP